MAKSGNADSAIVVGLECIRLAENSQLDDSTTGAWLLTVGRISNSLQKYGQAASLFGRAIKLWETAFKDNNPLMLTLFSYHSYALIYAGQYAPAEVTLNRGLAGWERSVEPDTSYAAKLFTRIGVICMNQGRIDDAQAAYERAHTLIMAESAPNVTVLRGLMNNYAYLHLYQKRFDEAEQILLSLVEVLENADSVNVSYLSSALHNLAVLYSDLEQFDKSEAYFNKTIQLESSMNGPDSYPVAMALTSLGNVLMLQGKLVQAGEAYERALKIKKERSGTSDRSIANTLIMYSQLEREKGNTEHALQLAAESFEFRRANFVNNSWALAEGNAIKYSQVMRGSANSFFASFADRAEWDDKYVSTAANIILATKGQVTDCMFDRRESLGQVDDSALTSLTERYRSTAKALSGLYFRGPGKADPVAFREKMDSLGRVSKALESELAAASVDFRTNRDLQDVRFEQVRQLLPSNSVLIEYVEFEQPKIGDSIASRSYFALVLSPSADPVVVDLGSAEQIESVVVEYRQNYEAVSHSWPETDPELVEQSRAIHEKLHSHLIAPVKEYLHDMELVLIAPDGALNLVSFGGLQDSSGDYMIEKYALHYLATGRDLVRLQHGPQSGSGLLAFGGIDFESGSVTSEQADAEDESALRSTESGETEITLYAGPTIRDGLDPLPYTRREVSRVARIWEQTRNEATFVVTGGEASEERFKQHAPGNRVIHCATHGFFGGQQLSDALGEGSAKNSGSGHDNPLVKSGLFFAGVIERAAADQVGDDDDGFLTALEVGNIDLRGVEWVVLSACGSGLGEVQRGEGVYGLRRGFIMAGARTVISALWAVPDKQSQSMMEQLYSSGETNLAHAMQRMALKEITDLRSRGLSTHPFSWAAFVAVGDWRAR